MRRTNLRRFVFAISALLCLSAAFSAVAMGAGKPSLAKITWAELPGLNTQNFVIKANPNGAATSVALEYKEFSASTWVTASSKAIGSGTETVEYTARVLPVLMHTKYQARVTATNSYGSLTSGNETFGVKWRIFEGVPGWSSPYIATGTFKVEWDDAIGNPARIECNQSGSGEFGPEAISEALNLSLTGCSYYYNNSLYCKPKGETVVKLNNLFQATEKVNFQCPEEMLTTVTFAEAFVVPSVAANLSPAVSQPLTMTNNAKVGTRAATITSTSNMQLYGVNVGKKFYLLDS